MKNNFFLGLWCSRVFYFGSGSVLVCIFLRRASKILILQSMVHFDIFLAPSIFSESLLSGSRLSWDSPFFRQGYWAPPGSHWSVAKFNLSSRHAQPLARPTLFWALVLFAPFLGFPWPLGPFFLVISGPLCVPLSYQALGGWALSQWAFGCKNQ